MDTATAPTATGPAAPRRSRVVAGIDGSAGSRAALAWAMAAAVDRGADVQAVAAFPVEFSWTGPYLADLSRIEAVRADTLARATELMAAARREVADRGRGAPLVEVVVLPGPAAEHLVRQAQGADLLVVGSRGRGAVGDRLLGSVALHCCTHAGCDVVVVHPATPAPAPRVVVGLDDSAVARAALREAADEAARLRAELEVVAAYRSPNHWSDLYAVLTPSAGETREQARRRARQVVAEVLGDEGPRLAVRVVAAEGAPGEVLVREAAGARLLVVGRRSRSRLEGTVLGSVALHCVVSATCPVMVVHPQPVAPAVVSPEARAGGRAVSAGR